MGFSLAEEKFLDFQLSVSPMRLEKAVKSYYGFLVWDDTRGLRLRPFGRLGATARQGGRPRLLSDAAMQSRAPGRR